MSDGYTGGNMGVEANTHEQRDGSSHADPSNIAVLSICSPQQILHVFLRLIRVLHRTSETLHHTEPAAPPAEQHCIHEYIIECTDARRTPPAEDRSVAGELVARVERRCHDGFLAPRLDSVTRQVTRVGDELRVRTS